MARSKRKSRTRGGTSRKRKRKRSSKVRRLLPKLEMDAPKKAIIAGIGLIFFAGVLVLSLLSPNQGQLTSALARLLRQAFGWGGAVTPILMGAVGFYLVLWGMEQAPALPRWRLLGLTLLFLTFESFASLLGVVLDNGLASVWSVAQEQTGGGYLGGILAWSLLQAIGRPATILALAIIGLLSSVLVFGVSREEVADFLRAVWARRPRADAVTIGEREIPVNVNRPSRHSGRAATRSGTDSDVTAIRPEDRRVDGAQANAVPEAAAQEQAEPPWETGGQQAAEDRPHDLSQDASEKVGERTKGAIEHRDSKEDGPAHEPLLLGGANGEEQWELPELDDVLEVGGEQEISNQAIREQVEIIEHTLDSFGAPAKVVEINQGPTVTQFGVEPQFIERRSGKRTKVKVGKIAGLADDLALALAAHSVRVEAPVPGKGYVGLEVPNPQKMLVSLRDVMESTAFSRINSPLGLGLGQNVSGRAVAADLAKMPHLLIAGATGSGKSVCVNSIIACLLLQNTPEQLRMVMVDPKRVELTGYNGIPHLVAPVVVNMERVIGTLQWALREMDMRYEKLAEAGARNITDYNRKVSDTKKRHMPNIVIFIDELADLMMVSPEETERSITRLAQMARATGIHMVISTQRPSVDVVTGLIKANFPARIAFAVASGTDSRVILDSTGAERLLGQGDMLFQSPDAGAPVRLQGSFVSDRELGRIIDYWRRARRVNRIAAAEARRKKEKEATLPPPTQQPLWDELIGEAEEETEYEDELVPEAIELVRDLDRASTSLLQRRFRIGYTRAARIMDVMEEEGIIGPPTGTSKAREVLDYGDQDEGEEGDPPAAEQEAASGEALEERD